MDSPTRKKIQVTFSQVDIGNTFQLVNTVMGAAMPDGLQLVKTSLTKARRCDNGETVEPRLNSLVEVFQ